MTRTLLTLSSFVVVVAVAFGQEPPPAVRDLTRADMVRDLDLLEGAIRERWAYLEDKQANAGVDLAALVARAKAGLPEQGTPASFHEVVRELVAGLKDGYGDVHTPEVEKPASRWICPMGDSSDGIVVKALDSKYWLGWKPGETSKGILEGGDRLLRIEGAAVETRIAELEQTTIASTTAARRHRAIGRLQRTSAGSVEVKVAPESGKEVGASVITEVPPTPTGNEYYDCGIEECLMWWPLVAAPGIARMWVPTFGGERDPSSPAPDEVGMIDGVVDRLHCLNSKALILDLRNRSDGGAAVYGDDALAIRLARHLLPKRFVYFSLSSKAGGKWTAPVPYTYDPFPARGSCARQSRFDGPLALLIDEDCSGAVESFIRALVENRDDVIVIGRPTSGAAGVPAQIADLPASGTSVTLSARRVYGPRGTLIEGRGTLPTIPVRWTPADYRAGRDPDMEAAIDALRQAESRPAK